MEKGEREASNRQGQRRLWLKLPQPEGGRGKEKEVAWLHTALHCAISWLSCPQRMRLSQRSRTQQKGTLQKGTLHWR